MVGEKIKVEGTKDRVKCSGRDRGAGVILGNVYMRGYVCRNG